MSILSLQETSPGSWKATYAGNYGRYTIKVKMNGEKIRDFSCSCPSDYYPCKHIAMIEEAIRKRVAENGREQRGSKLTVERLLENVYQNELRDFIVNYAKKDSQFKNAVFLEFAHKVSSGNEKNANATNKYVPLLRKELSHLGHDDYDYGYEDEDGIELDALDQWLDKAETFANQNNADEAIQICKACIEEFASWYISVEDYIAESTGSTYQERPFEILEKIISLPGVDHKSLFDYCKSEMQDPKYKSAYMYDDFSKLFMDLSLIVGSGDFIAAQDSLLQKVDSDDLYEMEKILQRKIDFYRKNGQPEMAWDVIKENLRIESFREELIRKLIDENKLSEARKLINEVLQSDNKGVTHSNRKWYELKLQIAQKEKKVAEIREISYRFIESEFGTQYYEIYKSTFTKKGWPDAVENLINHYEKNYKSSPYGQWAGSLCGSAADVLAAEKQAERLMKYVAKKLSIVDIDKYHTFFASEFPEETLKLFQKAIDKYAEKNIGRSYYENIGELFSKMKRIKGGEKFVTEMIERYRVQYKRRNSMVRVIKERMDEVEKLARKRLF